MIFYLLISVGHSWTQPRYKDILDVISSPISVFGLARSGGSGPDWGRPVDPENIKKKLKSAHFSMCPKLELTEHMKVELKIAYRSVSAKIEKK